VSATSIPEALVVGDKSLACEEGSRFFIEAPHIKRQKFYASFARSCPHRRHKGTADTASALGGSNTEMVEINGFVRIAE